MLILAIGALILYSAYPPALRAPVLVAAAFEKFAIGLFVFFGPVKRTCAMTAIATVDGVFVILYVAYLAVIKMPVPGQTCRDFWPLLRDCRPCAN